MYSTQVCRQYSTPDYRGKRSLDFGPYQSSLSAFNSARKAELDTWLIESSLTQIHSRLTSGLVTSRDLILYYLQRIQQDSGSRLNAVVELNPEALALADQLDLERSAGRPIGPLHGIPILLKDNIATCDRMHTTAGAFAMKEAQSDRDSFIVQKLRAAGALLLGKANLSEWANFMTSRSANGFSVLGGQTINPYGRYDVSGSSSGSAAAVSANLIPVAVGTETCGSLISPGSANSIVSLKPSLGIISRDRIIPITGEMDTAGPMARSVTDLCVLLNCLVGPDSNDPITSNCPLQNLDFTSCLNAGSLSGKRIGFVLNSGSARIFGQSAARARQILSDLGAVLIDVSVHRTVTIQDYRNVLFYGMKHDLNRYLSQIKGYSPFKSLEEIIRFNSQDPANRAPFGQDFLEKAQQDRKTEREQAALAENVRNTAVRTLRATRKKHRLDFFVSFHNALSILYAPAGFPALTVPAGYRPDGRPVGITFVGDKFEDGELIAAAFAFEQAARLRKKPEDTHQ